MVSNITKIASLSTKSWQAKLRRPD